MLPVPCGEGGGDTEKVQGHHQDCSQPSERCPVCPVRRRPQGRSDGAGEDPAADDQIRSPGGAPLPVPAALCQTAERGDKNKVQKLVQMAWTFVNDSLCTMLSLQWEPEIIAVAVMYLAGRLCKFDIQEWTSKQSSRRWWEQFVQDVPVELLEDICHQILDLYSQGKQPIPQQPLLQEKEKAPPTSQPPQQSQNPRPTPSQEDLPSSQLASAAQAATCLVSKRRAEGTRTRGLQNPPSRDAHAPSSHSTAPIRAQAAAQYSSPTWGGGATT
ncbi:hypothetical protein AGOR_G00081630, partial [Albula goreensis]